MANINLEEEVEKLEDFVKKEYPDHIHEILRIKDAYRRLVNALRDGKGAYFYSDLAIDIGLVSSVDAFTEDISIRDELKYMVGLLSEFEVNNRRPMISAMVIKKVTYKPGKGFYVWASELGELKNDKNREDFWQEQMNELKKCWEM